MKKFNLRFPDSKTTSLVEFSETETILELKERLKSKKELPSTDLSFVILPSEKFVTGKNLILILNYKFILN